MTRRFVQQLADGEAVEDVFLVSDKQLRANRNGNTYIQVDLRDRTGVINARLWKMRSLVVSGMMAALAGGFYARVLLVVTPDSVFGMLVSAQAVVVTLFGGVASVWGPLIGAAILVPLLYLPGVPAVGQRLYLWVARNRYHLVPCHDGACAVPLKKE